MTHHADGGGPGPPEPPAAWVGGQGQAGPGSAPKAGEPGAGVSGELAKRRPRFLHGTVLTLIIVLGLGSIAGGGVALAREFTRGPTNAEKSAALASEIATRWLRLPAGAIFPAVVTYPNADGLPTTARRVGIARPGSCPSSLDAAAELAIRPFGCEVTLRATYVDASGTLAATIGIAVMRSAAAADTASGNLDQQTLNPVGNSSGVRAATFPGTITATFTDHQRVVFGIAYDAGPYVFFYAAGFADGRSGRGLGRNPGLSALGIGIVHHAEMVLTSHRSPCRMPDILC